VRIQTHLSENVTEVEFTRSLYPGLESYTAIYDSFNLLGPRTILAHAIHLSDAEMALIAKRKCGVSHCPVSNGNLSSGASRVGEMLNRGIKVGLGSDASGGFSLGMLGVIREASVVAKVLNFSNLQTQAKIVEASEKKLPDKVGEAEDQTMPESVDFCKGPLRLSTLFYLATLGGAEVCSLSDSIGSLDVGKVRLSLLNPSLIAEPFCRDRSSTRSSCAPRAHGMLSKATRAVRACTLSPKTHCPRCSRSGSSREMIAISLASLYAGDASAGHRRLRSHTAGMGLGCAWPHRMGAAACSLLCFASLRCSCNDNMMRP
jgi:hypothetical protein